MDGFREFPGSPGAAAKLAEDLPCLELRVRPLAGGSEPRVGAAPGMEGVGRTRLGKRTPEGADAWPHVLRTLVPGTPPELETGWPMAATGHPWQPDEGDKG